MFTSTPASSSVLADSTSPTRAASDKRATRGYQSSEHVGNYYRTANGAFIIKRDHVKIKAFGWFGDVLGGKPGEQGENKTSESMAYWFSTKESPDRLVAFYEKAFPGAEKGKMRPTLTRPVPIALGFCCGPPPGEPENRSPGEKLPEQAHSSSAEPSARPAAHRGEAAAGASHACDSRNMGPVSSTAATKRAASPRLQSGILSVIS